MRSLRPRRVELSLAGLVLAGGAVEIVLSRNERWPFGVGSYALGVGVLLLARTRPLVVAPLAASIYALTPLTGFDASQPGSWVFVLGLAAFATGLFAQPTSWLRGLASVLAELAISYAGLVLLTDFDPSLLFGVAMSLGPWGLGLALRTALEQERRAGVQAERMRVTLALAREKAVTEERERIAGELNDILVHALGAMLVQASAASDLVRREAPKARQALSRVAEAGREALADTGRLLRVLREGPDEPVRPEPRNAGDARSQRMSLRDVLVPGGLGVVATVEILSHHYGPFPIALGTFWLAAAVLVARRAVPLAMPVAVTAILVFARPLGVPIDDPVSTGLVTGFACFAAGRHARSRTIVSIAAVAAALVLLVVDAVARGDASDGPLVALVLLPWGIGISLRKTLARARELAATAERIRLETESESEDALVRERRRIARELHDVLARSLSVMSIQASLAAELVETDPQEADAAVAEVESAGRAALNDTGRLLHLIRSGIDNGTHPQPGVADLPTLADECARSGLTIDLEQAHLGHIPPGIDVSVYRIVEEALTNALKHAPGSGVRVRLARHASAVAIEVVNGRANGRGHASIPSGHGLAGLQERVNLFGGTLEARPTADGGFLLAARMPVEEAA